MDKEKQLAIIEEQIAKNTAAIAKGLSTISTSIKVLEDDLEPCELDDLLITKIEYAIGRLRTLYMLRRTLYDSKEMLKAHM